MLPMCRSAGLRTKSAALMKVPRPSSKTTNIDHPPARKNSAIIASSAVSAFTEHNEGPRQL